MSDRPLESIVGDDLTPRERERLTAVHDLLLAVGPPPELPPWLAEAPPEPRAQVIPLPRRFRFTTITAAALVAIALFGGGYLVGGGDAPKRAEFLTTMTGSGAARAELAVFAKDAAGNWPMELTVEGLPPLPDGRTYELWLTRNGMLSEPCGTFVVDARTTTVPLNAPYPLRQFDGWVVVETGSESFVLQTETV